MPEHRGHQPCIVCGFPPRLVLSHQLFPLGKDGSFVAEEREKPFDPNNILLDLGWIHSESVYLDRTRTYHPVLINYLRDEAGLITLSPDCFDSLQGHDMLSVSGLGRTGQDVGVDKDSHSPRPA